MEHGVSPGIAHLCRRSDWQVWLYCDAAWSLTRARNSGLVGCDATMRRCPVQKARFQVTRKILQQKIQKSASYLRKLANLIFDKQGNEKPI